jgi:hypothetical protein
LAFHVVRRAGARLIGVDDELIAKPSVEHFVCRGDNRARDLRLETAQGGIGLRGGFLDQDRCRDEIGPARAGR